VSSSHEERIKLGSTAIAVPHLAHSEYASAPTLAALRKLIKDAGYAPHDACDHVSAQPASLHGKVVVCVTTRDARLYRLDGDEGEEEATLLHAADPRSRRRHLHIKHGDRGKAGTPAYHGDWAPVPEPAFLASIAAALKEAELLIIVSHGKGKSDAALALEKHLASHAPSVAAKVAGHAHVSEGAQSKTCFALQGSTPALTHSRAALQATSRIGRLWRLDASSSTSSHD